MDKKRMMTTEDEESVAAVIKLSNACSKKDCCACIFCNEDKECLLIHEVPEAWAGALDESQE